MTTVNLPGISLYQDGHKTLDTTDIIDNLTSTSTADVLSAKQGKILNDKIPITRVGFGQCSTAAATAEKSITISDASWTLKAGNIIGVYFENTNSASNVTLNVNNSGAKPIWYSNAVYTASSSTYCGYASRYIYYMYDGTNWVWLNCGWSLNSDTVPAAHCTTSASTAAKTATMTYYTATPNSYVHVNLRYANTKATALTLNINSQGAKPIYINGTVSSNTNYTLPAGPYIVYYDGTNYYFRTDGKLTANITGDAGTVNGHTVAANVPSNAKFTDTTYTAGNNITISTSNVISATVPTTAQSNWTQTDTTAIDYIKNKPGNVTTSTAGFMTAADKTKLNGVATGAEVNQNAFSNIKVSSTTVSADSKTDTVELVAGNNVTLTPDATNDKITIAATNTTYTSKSAASGGTDVSLVTTGEKYTWNNKANASHNQASNTINAMTGYSKPSSTSAIGTSDTLNAAIGKLEKGLDNLPTVVRM